MKFNGDFLQKQVGPFKVWVWGVVLVGGVFLMNKMGGLGGATPVSPVADVPRKGKKPPTHPHSGGKNPSHNQGIQQIQEIGGY
jgi:hypothetical protein